MYRYCFQHVFKKKKIRLGINVISKFNKKSKIKYIIVYSTFKHTIDIVFMVYLKTIKFIVVTSYQFGQKITSIIICITKI